MKQKSNISIKLLFPVILFLNACEKTDNLVSSNVSVTTMAKGVNNAVGSPTAMAIDPQGNIYELYVSYQYNVLTLLGRIQKITSSGMVSGYNGYFFTQIAIDAAGNFYGSTGNYIVKVNFDSGSSELAGDTLRGGDADGTGYSASFGYITSLATDSDGNLFAGDLSNLSIRKITSTGVVTTFAGNGIRGNTDGNSSTAEFEDLAGIGIDAQNNIYVSDIGSNRIRKITPTGIVSTLATNVTAYVITVDPKGNVYFILGNAIDKIDSTGKITSFAGSSDSGNTDGNGNVARFNGPALLISDKQGNIFVTDFGNDAIRKITVN